MKVFYYLVFALIIGACSVESEETSTTTTVPVTSDGSASSPVELTVGTAKEGSVAKSGYSYYKFTPGSTAAGSYKLAIASLSITDSGSSSSSVTTYLYSDSGYSSELDNESCQASCTLNFDYAGLDNGSTYYYKVAAVNSSGTGTLSSVASALLSANIQGSQTYNAHTYAMTSEAMTFAEAKAAAVAVGGYLTTVNTKAENTFLTNKFYAAYGNKALWIGANDIATEDTWVWDNGTTSGDSGLTDNICGTGCNPSSDATWADATQ